MRQDVRELATSLAELPVLAGCSARALRRLAEAGRLVQLPAEWTVVSESTPGDTCYLVLGGEAEVRRGGEPVTTIGRGALFGEASALDRHLRNASVVATTTLRVLSMQCADLLQVFEAHPELGERLLAGYRRRTVAAG